MPAFHLLRCMVALGGDQGNQVYRHRDRPIVFPELPILQFIHGEEAITEIFVVGTWEASNDEVLQRLQTIYQPETVQAVYPGNRPRLPVSDASVPRCTLPIYKPRPTRPDSPDPKLRPLSEFTYLDSQAPVLDAPDLPRETEPTVDEIAAHAQDDVDDVEGAIELGLDGPKRIRPEDLAHIVRDTSGRGASTAGPLTQLPDVNAGGSHSPNYKPKSGGGAALANRAARGA
jgi:hypothetical protein